MMKTTWKIHLALMMMLAVILAAVVPVYAAGEKHTVKGTFEIDGEAPKSEFIFSLYQVGDFGRDEDGNVTLDLLPKIIEAVPEADLDLDELDRSKFETEEEWQEAWLAKADIIAKSGVLTDDDKAADDQPTDSDGTFTFSPVTNGLYLLISDSNYPEPEKDENGSTVTWRAKPMLVMVLDNDVELTVKPLKETEPCKYMVIKSWSDSGNEKVRPKEIKVEIYYDYKTGEKNEPVETVTLNASNNWCYTWSIENEKYADKTGDKYTVKEVITSDISKTYTVSQSENTNKETNTKTFNITNTYKKTDNPSSNPKVKTGDQGGMWKYYLLGAAALIVLIAVFVRLRSKKDSSQD